MQPLEGEQTDTPTMLIGTRQIERKHPWLERRRQRCAPLNTFIELIVNLKPFVIFPHRDQSELTLVIKICKVKIGRRTKIF